MVLLWLRCLVKVNHEFEIIRKKAFYTTFRTFKKFLQVVDMSQSHGSYNLSFREGRKGQRPHYYLCCHQCLCVLYWAWCSHSCSCHVHCLLFSWITLLVGSGELLFSYFLPFWWSSVMNIIFGVVVGILLLKQNLYIWAANMYFY